VGLLLLLLLLLLLPPLLLLRGCPLPRNGSVGDARAR
jgi:hypothetical protein